MKFSCRQAQAVLGRLTAIAGVRWLTVVLATYALLWPLAGLVEVARAEGAAEAALVSKAMEIGQGDRGLDLSFDATEFGTADVRRKLRNGLPQNLVVRALTYREGGREVVAATAQSCRVVYDLWEGIYRVQLQLPGNERTLEFDDVSEVLRSCLRLQQLPFPKEAFGELQGKRVYCTVHVELNPVSQATVQRIRRWLSRSSSAGQLRGDAFFGSFVSIFVGRDIGRAERAAAYRSQLWAVP